ncbi:RNA demethylase ALKBH9B [Telopea speciosissima]|uniref:RNA demethylase ALKBH9B n=1 Tax=Telopea speciosissima TaxID=54955 RepID=UPI001CC37B7C|nr:RNA demethylase ALKBH9B [Telopea speciosissima]
MHHSSFFSSSHRTPDPIHRRRTEMKGSQTRDDPFLLNYQTSDLQIAAEFLTHWLPFLSRDLCHGCTQILADRIRSLDPDSRAIAESPADAEYSNSAESLADSSPTHPDSCEASHGNHENCDTYSIGSWKDEANWSSEHVVDASASETPCEPDTVGTPSVRMSWADMAQEDELEEEAEEMNKPSEVDERASPAEEVGVERKVPQKQTLSREQREYIRFMNVKRKKDFICLERVKGKIVNILDGLELHTGVFSTAEQKRIVDFIYDLQEKGRKGELKVRTYSAPQKWMRGKGRVTIQFGCCYNYATDKNGNPPGILRDEEVDPIPHLFKVIIKRLVGWHIIPPSCVPDSCIVNIYEEGDCIPPHIDSHDFVRPFCTISFLSECDIMFGSNLKVVGAGEFTGSFAFPLPVGSVLVLNGNGADVAKHCVPAVPTKRISITFRKMDESKLPLGFAHEPDLQGLQPLPYDLEDSKRLNTLRVRPQMNRHAVKREVLLEKDRGLLGPEPRHFIRNRSGPPNKRKG